MKLGIMQPCFLPYLGYFQLIHAVDRFLLYPNVSFTRAGWTHRNRILLKWGGPMYVHLPVRKASGGTRIAEVLLDDRDPAWRRKLLATVHHNYAASPFFAETWPLIREVIMAQPAGLHAFNAHGIRRIAAHLGLHAEIISDGKPYLDIEERLEPQAASPAPAGTADLPASPERKTARILALCQRESADCYVNLIGGLSLYDREVFRAHGLRLLFVSTRDLSYRQFSPDFHPRLSILDVLMHNGLEGTKRLLGQYSLI